MGTALPSIQIPVSPHIFTSISWAAATSPLPSLSPCHLLPATSPCLSATSPLPSLSPVSATCSLPECHLPPAVPVTGAEPLPQPQRPSGPSAAAIAAAPAPRGLPAPRLPHRQKNPRRSQEMPQGLRHRAPGAVVHGVPLEKGLPALPGLNSLLDSLLPTRNSLRNLGISFRI
ncbi:wiskott-Aldrich syndrome protein homolog 1-like [Motacilla alba alba]|uniref:wiskott-Aldrich syndrome protein homolog 1-like n=1 Tax=Motacilla alba alba TaxID=1094192 RepID=UPI0018D565C5|nr:wiskott-Aldrich syndrome protein homolog 1-like [Motacilla alba alba]